MLLTIRLHKYEGIFYFLIKFIFTGSFYDSKRFVSSIEWRKVSYKILFNRSNTLKSILKNFRNLCIQFARIHVSFTDIFKNGTFIVVDTFYLLLLFSYEKKEKIKFIRNILQIVNFRNVNFYRNALNPITNRRSILQSQQFIFSLCWLQKSHFNIQFSSFSSFSNNKIWDFFFITAH